jgi:hypothetical protein
VSTTGTALITWEKGPYSGYYDRAGSIHLFSVNWKTQRNAPDWTMQTVLPGFTGKQWTSDDREYLFSKAEEILAAWLARVTGKEA